MCEVYTGSLVVHGRGGSQGSVGRQVCRVIRSAQRNEKAEEKNKRMHDVAVATGAVLSRGSAGRASA